jgi:hypothetical protein
MMATRALIDEWLSARVPGARLDQSGIAAVKRDEDTVILVEVPDGDDTCHLYALLAPLPEGEREAALLAALELNRFGKPLGGCWIAWENEIQMLTLCHNFYVPGGDSITFGNALDNFLSALDQARAIFIPQDAEEARGREMINDVFGMGLRA